MEMALYKFQLLLLFFFILLSARVPKDRIYPVLVTQARYVAPYISDVSKSRFKSPETTSMLQEIHGGLKNSA